MSASWPEPGPASRLASLPMYTAAGRETLQRFWLGLSVHLRARGLQSIPEALQFPDDDLRSHWLEPGLLLSQACGYPYVHFLQGRGVQVVGAFHHAAPGCSGARYRSFLVCRQDDPARRLLDFRGRVAVVNGRDSQSGCNALRAAMAEAGAVGDGPCGRFFARAPVSGAHADSLQWVKDGRADIASIDCVSLASFLRHGVGAMDGLRVLGDTPDAPGLPLVTSASLDAADMDRLRGALQDAIEDPLLAVERDRLLINGFEALPAAAYGEIVRIEREAEARGITFP